MHIQVETISTDRIVCLAEAPDDACVGIQEGKEGTLACEYAVGTRITRVESLSCGKCWVAEDRYSGYCQIPSVCRPLRSTSAPQKVAHAY